MSTAAPAIPARLARHPVARVLVCLSAEEESKARAMAERRNNPKVEAGYGFKGTFDTSEPTIIKHTWGAYVEYAVAKLTGGTLDTRSHAGGDDGAPDLILATGKTLEVKGGTKTDSNLMLPERFLTERFPADAIILGLPLFSRTTGSVDVVGWTYWQHWKAQASLFEWKSPSGEALKAARMLRTDLLPIGSLLESIGASRPPSSRHETCPACRGDLWYCQWRSGSAQWRCHNCTPDPDYRAARWTR